MLYIYTHASVYVLVFVIVALFAIEMHSPGSLSPAMSPRPKLLEEQCSVPWHGENWRPVATARMAR